MKDTTGVANAKNPKPPDPKPSPKDFVWPSQKDADDAVAKKIAASLQELLPKKEWTHVDLAREMYGVSAVNNQPRNSGQTRRWIVAEHPIPSELHGGYIAQLLDVPMSRLLEPEGKFVAVPDMLRFRSDSKRFGGKGKKTAGGKDREKQRAYNLAYRERMKAAKGGKRKYVKRAKANGDAREDGAWILAEGVEPPEFTISSEEQHPGHVKIEVTATLPHERAMAILHMLQHSEAPKD